MDQDPIIFSLDEWKVPLNDDVAKILAQSVHLDKALANMKVSPVETTCRIVGRKSSLVEDHAMETIRGTLQPWMQARSIMNSEVRIETHRVLRDVVTIQIDHIGRNLRLVGEKRQKGSADSIGLWMIRH